MHIFLPTATIVQATNLFSVFYLLRVCFDNATTKRQPKKKKKKCGEDSLNEIGNLRELCKYLLTVVRVVKLKMEHILDVETSQCTFNN